MSKFQHAQDYNRVTITTAEVHGIQGRAQIVNFLTATAWPTANKALYVPVPVFQPFIALKILVHNGTASGNIDAGIYDDQGRRVVSMGSTAGVSGLQALDIADTTLHSGIYYLALAVDNTTATVVGAPCAAATCAGAMGVLMQTSAFPLPAPATFAAAVDTFVPLLGITGRTVV